MDTSKPISVKEAARRLKMKPRTVQRYCAALKLGKRFGRVFVLSAADLDQLRPFRGREPGNPGFKERKSVQ